MIKQNESPLSRLTSVPQAPAAPTNNEKSALTRNIAKIIKFLFPISIAYFETPLHEGLHALIAKIMPHASCSGVIISSHYWYSSVLQFLTFGFYKAGNLPTGVAGQASISIINDFLGHLSETIISAGPEIITVALGLYWIKRGLEQITLSGQRLYSMLLAYCGVIILSSAFNYMSSSVAPGSSSGSDYMGFTAGILRMLHLPDFLAPFLTVFGSLIMFWVAMHIARVIPTAKKGAKRSK
jgi:hypothetical protein